MGTQGRPNIIKDKSFAFAVQILRVGRRLRKDHGEFALSDQLIRSGTSIGANVEEALGGQSRRDFASKMAIAAKEARETHYWLRLAREAALIEVAGAEQLLQQCTELLAILNSIILTTRHTSARPSASHSEFIIQNSELHRAKRGGS